jgi:hypothetical protein
VVQIQLLFASVIVGLGATALLLFFVFYFIRLANDPQLVATIAHLRGKYREESLPAAFANEAVEAAEQRRQFLSRFNDVTNPAEFPRFEIREFPPGIEAIDSRRELSPSDAVGQMVRLRWQLKRPELLLLERVVDTALGILERRLGDSSARITNGLLGAVRVEPAKRRSRDPNIFPWTVILETNYPGLYRAEFERLRNWLAIGIDFDRPTEFVGYGLCQVPGGERGEVGGVLHLQDSELAMTCAHVLSDQCGSLVVRGEPRRAGQQPDAALISMQSPCFQIHTQPRSGKVPATRDEIDRCHRREDTVRYANIRHKSVRGYLYGTLSEFPIDGTVYRFPHEAVVPATRLILGILPWPPGTGLFSEPGDSGSWILTEKSDNWIGMLVGGDPFTRTSYIADGQSLLSFFELELARGGHANAIGMTVPFAFE